ncbi:MAG: 30S ribosomal protein S19 [Candidatus Portnoybacteria bacterium CG23_combo_of_CG06-09_8_20_14_all_37_13]|uniref:Small ribosomal subunit protein uS19 n=1 Tax=Candidatus Portnoybacteria bacterium CG23_combo_of_CG06-09_8_20_14_all_37_13 TaxID=1974819 RepID=A0A2G9YDT3_9BACT|nr:MAG: 30S ribosomal protein S19 [Candidatus Portnoybacteria bacterium CG23_combo_of_CG06-09_8_20_14_all_37_13]
MSLFIDQKLLEKVKKIKKDSRQAIKTWSRRAVITPEMIGHIFLVHNGKEFIKVGPVHEDMVGHRLGEFSPTTKFLGHGGKKAQEEEKKTKEQIK